MGRTDDYITQIRRLTIAEHIGFDADSIQHFGSKIIALNSKLNAADRLDDTAIGNRILIAITVTVSLGQPQLGRWAFYWEGVFGAVQNVGRFWCRYPARLLWASGGHPRGQSRLI
eukprot:scaffold22463_cov149-Isochrysis_galbana.AAC.1